MKNRVKKTAVLLVAILVSTGVFGNALLAEDREPVGLISAADLAFITGEPQGIASSIPAATPSFSPTLIPAADLAFLMTPFAAVTGKHPQTEDAESIGMITAGDYRFLTGQSDANFLSAFDYFAKAWAGSAAR